MRQWVGALWVAACLSSAGCVSLGGEAPGGEGPAGADPWEERGLPRASRACCSDLALTHTETFNGVQDEDEASDAVDHDEERAALTALVQRHVLETGLVGFVGQEGLEGTRLAIDVRRDVSASILHGVGSALTLFLFPYWIQVTYEVRAELHGAAGARSGSSASRSWYVLVNPFLVLAMPFDEPAEPLRIVDGLARSVLADLVLQEQRREREGAPR